MKRICVVLATVVLLVAMLPLPARAQEAFVVESLDVHMQVRDDNSYLVTETWDVRFSQQRHGLILTIPLRTYNGRPVEVSGVSVEGHPFTTSRENGVLEVQIGDANAWANQQERYAMSYRFSIGDDGLRDMDELYYNLIGGEVGAVIEQMTFSIEMPHDFDQSVLNFTHGQMGSTDNKNISWSVTGNTITGRLQKENRPGEMLTVALPLPEGYFASVERKTDIGTLLTDYFWLWMLLLAGLGVLLWKIVLKNRRIFPTVEFYAPQGTTPADVGYLIDGRVDPFDVTSLLVYWADRGYITITETTVKKGFGQKKCFILQKLREMGMEAKPYERVMFQDLFRAFARADGFVYTTDLEQSHFYTTVDKVKKLISDSYHKNVNTRIYQSRNGLRPMLVRLPAFGCLWIVAFVLLDTLAPNPLSTTAVTSAGAALLLTLLLGELVGFITGWKTAPRKGRIKRALTLGLPSAVLVGMLLYAGAVNGLLPPVILGLLSAAVPLWLSCAGGRRTELGNKYMELLLGFKGFLEAVERDRINLLVEQNPRYFYNVLPYAMVLGVTDKWARGFEQIAIPPPDWYRTDQWAGGFRAGAFASSLSVSLQGFSVSVESARPSRSSGGSSGGGSAGGGSGGTGAKSW